MTALHALYRFFSESGELLYVGITMNPVARWKQHSHEKTWWTEVAHVSIEPHVDRAAVLVAERLAITTEKPKYNKTHSSVEDSTKSAVNRLRWKCDECGLAIHDKDGYLTRSEAQLSRYEETQDQWKKAHTPQSGSWQGMSAAEWLTHPVPVQWKAYHRSCDPEPDDPGYWIGVERIRTYPAMLDWTAHLMSKRWLEHTDWDQLIYRVLSDERARVA